MLYLPKPPGKPTRVGQRQRTVSETTNSQIGLLPGKAAPAIGLAALFDLIAVVVHLRQQSKPVRVSGGEAVVAMGGMVTLNTSSAATSRRTDSGSVQSSSVWSANAATRAVFGFTCTRHSSNCRALLHCRGEPHAAVPPQSYAARTRQAMEVSAGRKVSGIEPRRAAAAGFSGAARIANMAAGCTGLRKTPATCAASRKHSAS